MIGMSRDAVRRWPPVSGRGFGGDGLSRTAGCKKIPGEFRRELRGRALAGLSAILLAIMAVPSTSSGEPLDEAACAELGAIRQKHMKSGIEQTFKKGVEWAKANLSEAALAEIKEYLTVEDKLLFRCKEVAAKVKAPEVSEKTDTRSATTGASTKTIISKTPLPVRPSRARR